MTMEFPFGDVWLNASLFDHNSLRDKIAYDVATAGAVSCRDVAAAMELVRYTADGIIAQVKADGAPPDVAQLLAENRELQAQIQTLQELLND